MKLLLDSHALLWLLTSDSRLSRTAREAITMDAEVTFVSAATAWEISTKYRIGKLPSAKELAANFAGVIHEAGLVPLSVSIKHGQLAGGLEGSHKDPFDRMLIAQALLDNLTLVSNEAAFDRFEVVRLW